MWKICMFSILTSSIFTTCQRNLHFVNAESELNAVLDGKKDVNDLEFSYERITFLDTGLYQIISQFDGFDFEINPREELALLVNLSYDTIVLKNSYESIEEVIRKDKSFHRRINPYKSKIHGPIPVFKNRAIITVANNWYLVEILTSNNVGYIKIDTAFYDGFPKSLIKKWERRQKRDSKKAN